MSAEICVKSPSVELQEHGRLLAASYCKPQTSHRLIHTDVQTATPTVHHTELGVGVDLQQSASKSNESQTDRTTLGLKLKDLTSSWFDPPWGIKPVKTTECQLAVGT